LRLLLSQIANIGAGNGRYINGENIFLSEQRGAKTHLNDQRIGMLYDGRHIKHLTTGHREV
jgi:hypothetical protein